MNRICSHDKFWSSYKLEKSWKRIIILIKRNESTKLQTHLSTLLQPINPNSTFLLWKQKSLPFRREKIVNFRNWKTVSDEKARLQEENRTTRTTVGHPKTYKKSRWGNAYVHGKYRIKDQHFIIVEKKLCKCLHSSSSWRQPSPKMCFILETTTLIS